MKAVRFDNYGDINGLRVADVAMPEPDHGEVLVRFKAASINPGEAGIRQGLVHAMWPATFPSGEGSNFAGTVAKLGSEVAEFSPGDEVCGFTDRRASHAVYLSRPKEVAALIEEAASQKRSSSAGMKLPDTGRPGLRNFP
jgi:NADPH:quinone reductase-like Zn-dependent oxidoreductase